MNKIILSQKIKPRIENGHPWIFGNEIARIEGKPAIGDIVEVFNHRKQFIGKGFYSSISQIAVRLLTRRSKEKINADFFRERLTAAWEMRKKIGFTQNARLVFSEADGLSGLTIDKFGDYFVVQITSAGMELWRNLVIEWLHETFSVKGIYERSDGSVRDLEGLERVNAFMGAAFNTSFVIETDGIQFEIDVAEGQKTGFFLDQRENRKALAPFVQGATVLDCFSYTGSFALYAAKFGARSVIGLDVSAKATEAARKNAVLNGLDSICQFETADVFDKLPEWVAQKKKFDVVILDPPAFTKSRATLNAAKSGYKEINRRAMELLNPGGFLVTCSCSHWLSAELLQETTLEAASEVKRKVRQVLFQTQAPDHPIVWSIPETSYLKFFILEIS